MAAQFKAFKEPLRPEFTALAANDHPHRAAGVALRQARDAAAEANQAAACLYSKSSKSDGATGYPAVWSMPFQNSV
jgi:hypothetical protein